MESGIRRIFLITCVLSCMLSSGLAVAQDSDEDGLIEPEVERTEFFDGSIGTHDLIVSTYGGMLSVEDFDTNPVSGFELAFQVTERFFVQYLSGTSSVGETSFEVLSGSAALLTEDERDVEYYLINVGFNLLPGESFITSGTTLNTAFYVTAGVGSTTFGGDDRATQAFAFGNRIKFNDWLGTSIELRQQQMETDLFGEVKTSNNLEATIAFSLFF